MALDLAMFADKLQRYRRQFEVSLDELSLKTGISMNRLTALSEQKSEPTGDEILILADFFKCDFKFFISNERLAPFEQTENLFRKHGDILSPGDRWAIQEFLFLCECQEFVLSQTSTGKSRVVFTFSKSGKYYKRHGEAAAAALRRRLNYSDNEIPKNIYEDFRRIGIHVFRRQLGQSSISGLFIRHPVAGPCVLVNYTEDVYRQRFTIAHEAAHAILDDKEEFVVSRWSRTDLSEVRANTFASQYLLPPVFLQSIPSPKDWNESKILEWAKRLMVNPETLVYALKEAELVSDQEAEILKRLKIPRHEKEDPELSSDLAPRSRERKRELFRRGLSSFYVGLCFDAYEQDLITAGRLAEMLLCDQQELPEFTALYGRRLMHAD